jgi:hypothetical protein
MAGFPGLEMLVADGRKEGLLFSVRQQIRCLD